MTNKKLTKKSKWLKLALISTATASTLATIPAAICAKAAVKTSTPTLDTKLNSTIYHTVTFKLREVDTEGPHPATITGKVFVEVEEGMRFNTIKKPTVDKFGYTFKGWSVNETAPEGEPDVPIQPTDTITNNITVYAIFVADHSLSIKGKPIVSLGEKNLKYTATVTPAHTYLWYVTDNLANPGETPSSEYAEISQEGVLKPLKHSTDESNTYVFAWPTNHDFPTGGFKETDTNVLKITVVDATEDPAYADSVIADYVDENGEERTLTLAPEQFYASSATTTVSGHEIGVTDQSYSFNKTSFNLPIRFGMKITKIKDGFMPSEYKMNDEGDWESVSGFCAFNKKIKFTNVQHIGSEFLTGNRNYNQSIEFSSKLLSIGNSFLDGSIAFNQTITFAPEGETPNIFFIGDSFLEGCTSLAQDFTLPASLQSVGEAFMYNCTSMNGKQINIECDVHSLRKSEASFAVDNNEEHTITFSINVKCNSDEEYDDLIISFPNEGETDDLVRELIKVA